MLFDQYEHIGTMIEQKKTLALEVGPCLIQGALLECQVPGMTEEIQYYPSLALHMLMIV